MVPIFYLLLSSLRSSLSPRAALQATTTDMCCALGGRWRSSDGAIGRSGHRGNGTSKTKSCQGRRKLSLVALRFAERGSLPRHAKRASGPRACGARKESFLRFYGTTPQPLLPTTTPARENRACRGPLLRSRRATAQVVPYTCLNVDAKSLIVK
jgi:hypothetical protein